MKGIQDDREALRDARQTSVLNALRRTDDPIPMQVWVVDGSTSVLKALRRTAPDAATLYAVYHGERLRDFIDERELMRAALRDPSARIGVIECTPVA